MKILDLKVTPVAIADPPLRNAPGVHEPYITRAIVELVGEDGLSGFGETACGSQTIGEFERVREDVVGRDVLHLTAISDAVAARLSATGKGHRDPVFEQYGARPRARSMQAERIYGAIEVAALDLAGRALGVPVCDLLGGRFRDRVPFSAYLFYKHAGGGGEGEDVREDHYGEALDPESLVAQARQMIGEYGFRSIKFKGGVLPPHEEIATVRQLRSAFGPEMPVRIDPNCNWSVETSIMVGKELAGSLEYFEDPALSIEGMAAVRKGLLAEGIDMPLATNMCVVSFADIPPSVASDAVQVILGDHHYWGGLRAITELGRLCETFGIGLSMHSNSHLGISLLAMTHVAAATPHLTYDCDTHYPWLHEADEILAGGKVPIRDGMVTVPDAPGLGVEVDRDALARGHERYLRVPYRDRDDAGEMRKKYDPTWEKLIPRW
ncbi:MAG TPA: enolase C-terminal domain-like protein [Thermomicrobiales bacterium]|nr:enolase C-terminal domain-like protein [Thermomicrobiales bacterium]